MSSGRTYRPRPIDVRKGLPIRTDLKDVILPQLEKDEENSGEAAKPFGMSAEDAEVRRPSASTRGARGRRGAVG